MRLLIALAAALVLLPSMGRAASPASSPVVACIEAAAAAHRLPPAVILILLAVEGGSLGRVSQNGNDTVDIGPMQINTIWVPIVARRWRATPAETFAALRDNFCANVEAGAWILRQAMDQARGDFWEGVGFYHSRTPDLKDIYLRKVLRETLRLQAKARQGLAGSQPPREAAAARTIAQGG